MGALAHAPSRRPFPSAASPCIPPAPPPGRGDLLPPWPQLWQRSGLILHRGRASKPPPIRAAGSARVPSWSSPTRCLCAPSSARRSSARSRPTWRAGDTAVLLTACPCTRRRREEPGRCCGPACRHPRSCMGAAGPTSLALAKGSGLGAQERRGLAGAAARSPIHRCLRPLCHTAVVPLRWAVPRFVLLWLATASPRPVLLQRAWIHPASPSTGASCCPKNRLPGGRGTSVSLLDFPAWATFLALKNETKPNASDSFSLLRVTARGGTRRTPGSTVPERRAAWPRAPSDCTTSRHGALAASLLHGAALR